MSTLRTFKRLYARSPLANRSGLGLVEILIDLIVVAAVILGLATGLRFLSTHSKRNNDKAFAIHKAMQLMEELRGASLGGTDPSVAILDSYDDLGVRNYVLTTNRSVSDPADALSGNRDRRFARIVTVRTVPNDPYSRQVRVQILNDKTGDNLAESISVLSNLKRDFVSTQVYDLYVLALENVPGWWTELSVMRPMFANTLEDMQSRNPALEFRTHWITRSAYGRDPYYTPYVNIQHYTTDADAGRWVYWYPGRWRTDSTSPDHVLYSPSAIAGRINVDGTVTNGSVGTLNSSSYSMADQFNHAARYPDELEQYNNAKAAALAAGRPAPEISLRMLIERLNGDPSNAAPSLDDGLRNAIIINLHGELTPLPPMRNYSDAAKDPQNHPQLRAVTHPEHMHYGAAEDPYLRVYAYRADGSAAGTAAQISLAFSSVDLAAFPSSISLEKLVGTGASGDYSWQAAKAVGSCSGNPDAAEFVIPGGTTQIILCDTPLDNTQTASGEGLAAAQAPYNLYYVPSETLGQAEFASSASNPNGTLADTGAMIKNTARWRIHVDRNLVPNRQVRIETWIGPSANKQIPLSNLSRTYFWTGTAQAPATERYQLMGDARHMPYVDIKTGAYVPTNEPGYNWYFRQLPSAAGQTDYDRTKNGWATGNPGSPEGVDLDLPRFYQLYRTGLLSSGVIWAQVAGFSHYYFGIGGEVVRGEFANPNVPAIEAPWSTSSGVTTETTVCEIANFPEGSFEDTAEYYNPRIIRHLSASGTAWYSKPWLGELYPDEDFSTWAANGNLPTSLQAGVPRAFYRASYDDPNLTPAYFADYDRTRRANEKGAPSFINGSPSGSPTRHFNHTLATTNTGTILDAGRTVARLFNLPLPTSTPAPRPFSHDKIPSNVSGWSDTPSEWADYAAQRVTTSILDSFYNASSPNSYFSSGVIKSRNAANEATYSVFNGLSSQASLNPAATARLALASAVRSYLKAGVPTDASTGNPTIGRITQLPYVSMTQPTMVDQFLNVTNIPIAWTSNWSRWDSLAYTEDPSYVGYSETVPLTINIKYSKDNGQTWHFVQDGAAAVKGHLDSSLAHALSGNSFTWDVSDPARYPAGNYILRIEAFRQGFPLHYAYHQRQIYINRS